MTNRQTHSRRRFLAQMGLAGASAACTTHCAKLSRGIGGAMTRAPKQPPNLILVVTDDQRWDALGCMGNQIIQTPHLDRLAADGVLFRNNFCTTSICMTSRASIFTGMYARRHGIIRFSDPLPDALFAQTYPVLLRGAGYRTGFVGKWGLGGPLPKGAFDYFTGFSGQGQYFVKRNGKEVHLTQIMGEQALEFLHGCAAGQPFCLSISTKASHVQDGHPDPFRYDPVYADLYKDVTIPTPKTADPKYFKMLPEFLQESEGRVRWKRRFSSPELYQHSVKNYYRLITGVDVIVGRILSLLEETGIADNTVIVYTSDNGFYLGEHGLAGKWFMHEESIRIPLLIHDPRLPSRARGRSRDEMTLNIDLAPTLLDLAGVSIPDNVQGQSLRPLLQGPRRDWRTEMFYEHLFVHPRIPRNEGVRDERWKYVRYLDHDYEELYDLENDRYEVNNLATTTRYRDRLEAMRRRLKVLRDAAA